MWSKCKMTKIEKKNEEDLVWKGTWVAPLLIICLLNYAFIAINIFDILHYSGRAKARHRLTGEYNKWVNYYYRSLVEEWKKCRLSLLLLHLLSVIWHFVSFLRLWNVAVLLISSVSSCDVLHICLVKEIIFMLINIWKLCNQISYYERYFKTNSVNGRSELVITVIYLRINCSY